MMKALVTGARGFIGSQLVETLIAQGAEVHCLLRTRRHATNWLSGLECKILAGDLTDRSSLSTVWQEFDYVFHLAGLTKALDPAQFDRVNTAGTENLLAAVAQHAGPLKMFVFVSSLAAAGPSRSGRPLVETDPPQPVSRYGQSKLAAERICLKYADSMPLTIVRPPAVYGPRDADVLTYFRYARRGLRPVIGKEERTASFIFVKDLVDGILLAAQKPAAAGRTYFLSDGQPHTWDELGSVIASVMGMSVRKIVLPLSLAFLAAAGADAMSRMTRKPSIINLDKYRELKMPHWVCSSARATAELGFRPRYTLKQGLFETATWYKQHGWL